MDFKRIRSFGGNGGNGCLSFLSVFKNEFAGPDGGDGGNGGDVLFQGCMFFLHSSDFYYGRGSWSGTLCR